MVDHLYVEIVEAIADAKGVEPDELELILQDYIEIDAVEKLADHDGAPWILSFELPEHEVTVASDGVILVDGNQEKIWA